MKIHAYLTRYVSSIVALFILMFMPILASASAADFIVKTNNKVPYSTAVHYAALIEKYSSVYNVDPRIVLSTMKVESTFKRYAVSSMGCKGLMQVCPRYHREKIAGRDIFDPEVNISIGVRILSENIKRHGSVSKGLQAYEGNMRSGKYYRSVLAASSNMGDISSQTYTRKGYTYTSYIPAKKNVYKGYKRTDCEEDEGGIVRCILQPLTSINLKKDDLNADIYSHILQT